MKTSLEIFVSFIKMGALTFGGGYSMLPLLQDEIVRRRGWSTQEELLDYYGVAQALPGLIAINTAVLIGYRKKGIGGAFFAALGVALPSLVIIILIANLLVVYSSNPYVIRAFNGVRVAVAALIANSLIKLWKAGVRNIFGFALFVLAFFAVAILSLSPIAVVLIAAGLGMLYIALGGGKS